MKQEHVDLLKKVLGEDSIIESELVGGMMNEAYIVKSGNERFVYYISTAQANEMVDRKLEKETQNIAFELGLTSENIYFDLEKGIKINRFIEGNSLNKIDDFDYRKVAKLLAKYHSSTKKSFSSSVISSMISQSSSSKSNAIFGSTVGISILGKTFNISANARHNSHTQ